MESTQNDRSQSDLDPSTLEDAPDQQKQIRLPEPDTDNITVLTTALPNDPILPWNRYDSPWLETEVEPAAESESTEAADISDGLEEISPESELASAVVPETLEKLNRVEASSPEIEGKAISLADMGPDTEGKTDPGATDPGVVKTDAKDAAPTLPEREVTAVSSEDAVRDTPQAVE